MNDFLLQIILAQRNDDAERLMNILFVVVLAAFWLIGGIIKAKANKSAERDKQSAGKPARKPPVHSREAREQMLSRLQRPAGSGSAKDQRRQPRPATQKPRMKFADLQAAVRKFAIEAEQAFQADTQKPIPKPKPKPVLLEPQIRPETLEFIEPVDITVTEPQAKQSSEAIEVFESEYLSELLTDYSDPDELIRAILHYEILGRPLSLRDSSEGGIGL
jgi:hypothetical protein